MNIAIFGGSFDPPHNAHDCIVRTALRELEIDKLIIIPTFLNPFKSEFTAPPSLRLKWCEELWGELGRTEISSYEINQNRAVASIESVEYFKKLYSADKIFLIIGADQIENLHKWREFTRLKNLVNFVVVSRDEVKIPLNLQKLAINVKISSSKIRQSLDFSQIPPKIKAEVEKFYKGIYARANRKNQENLGR